MNYRLENGSFDGTNNEQGEQTEHWICSELGPLWIMPIGGLSGVYRVIFQSMWISPRLKITIVDDFYSVFCPTGHLISV